MFVMSDEAKPFAAFIENAREEVKNRLMNLLEKMESDFRREADEFHVQLREWQELDDFIRVKKAKPVEPIPRLVFFSGHNVTAVDQLIDRRRMFLTLEKPDWRQGLRQPENNDQDLKTIGVDMVFVANGLRKISVSEHLRPDEVGFFVIHPHRPSFKDGWQEDLNELDKIEKNIFKLFSPAGSV